MPSARQKTTHTKAQTKRAAIRPVRMPVVIKTELRTGSGVRTLSVRRDTELRHVRTWPDGRRELMPRAYTSSLLFNASVVAPRLRNNGYSIFARLDAAYRRIDEHMAARRAGEESV